MIKRFVIRDYDGRPKKITISNYENVKVILYEKNKWRPNTNCYI